MSPPERTWFVFETSEFVCLRKKVASLAYRSRPELFHPQLILRDRRAAHERQHHQQLHQLQHLDALRCSEVDLALISAQD